MKYLPLSIQFFDDLIENNCIYVDKTEYIYRMLDQGGKPNFYFLSRPRRFGKSLLISTLEQLFLGRKDLFKGLWIEDKWSWEPHPVIKINFNDVDTLEQDLQKSLSQTLDKIGKSYGVSLANSTSKTKFSELIEKLANGRKRVILLIDEYDKPLVDFLDNAEKFNYHREVLKSFYSILKSEIATYLHFTLITGVSKFGKVSIFSDLNHLENISMDDAYTTLLGYTQKELEHYFKDYIQERI